LGTQIKLFWYELLSSHISIVFPYCAVVCEFLLTKSVFVSLASNHSNKELGGGGGTGGSVVEVVYGETGDCIVKFCAAKNVTG